MNDLFVRIRFLLPSLPRAEKAIASALLENPGSNYTFNACRDCKRIRKQ